MSVAPWFAPRSRRSAWWATRSSSSPSRCRNAATEARVSASSVSLIDHSRGSPSSSRSAWNRATRAATGCASGSPNTVAIQGILASSTDSHAPRTGVCPACGQVFSLLLERSMSWSRQARPAGKQARPADKRRPRDGAGAASTTRHAGAGSGQRPRAYLSPSLRLSTPLDLQPRGVVSARGLASLFDHRRWHPQLDGWNPRSRRLLPTTNTELSAIAAPAIIGDSSPEAARGSAATL